MLLNSDQKIEISKIAIGVIISIVGALWTYTTYTENERNNELKTLIGLGDAIAGMHVTCKSDFDKLADLAGEGKDTRKGQCYRYFQNAHRISLAAVITVKKPFAMSAKDWIAYWGGLQNAIAIAGSEKYRFNNIEDAWVRILIAKGLKEDAKQG
jgi:hypothetical protein